MNEQLETVSVDSVSTGSVRPRARRTSPLLLASLAVLASGGVPDYGRLFGSRPSEPRQKTQADLDALAAAEAKRKRKADRKASACEAGQNAAVSNAVSGSNTQTGASNGVAL